MSEGQGRQRGAHTPDEWFRRAFDNRLILMALSTLEEGRYIEVNDGFVELTGISRDEALGRTSVEVGVITVETRARHRALMAEQGRLDRVEIELARRDGSPLHCLYSADVIEVDGVQRLLSVAVDVTARRAAEAALARQTAVAEASRRLYQALFEASPDAVMLVEEGRYRVVNEAAARALGYPTPDAVAGMSVLDTVAPADRERVRARFTRTTDGERNPTEPVRIVRRDGSQVVAEATSVPIEIDGRRATLVIGHDVSHELAARADLARSEARYRMLFDAVEDAVLVADPDTGLILDCNRRAEDLLGRAREELVGLHQTALHPPDRARYHADTFAASTRAAGARFTDAEVLHRDGRRIPVEVSSGGTTRVGDREVHIGVFRDISERKAAEAARATLERQLLHAQKLEAVGRLAAGVAHDFNNLLTSIGVNASIATMDLPPGSPALESLNDIRRATGRAAELVSRLLSFSRQQAITPRVLEVNELVLGVQRMLARALGEHVTLRLTLATDAGCVEVDPGQLEQVLVNLVMNARDAMPNGGHLTIETATLPSREVPAWTDATRELVVIRVEDDGTGMDSATQQRVFEPFFTTKQERGGSGLGLATAYGIVKQHGGEILVRSGLGAGTTFEILLPRVAPDVAPPPRARARAPLPRGAERILLVEDEPLIRSATVQVLERLGYAVASFTDPVQALAHLETDRDFALLFTDVVMPHMNGRVLAEQARQRLPGLRVLFSSGYSGDTLAHQGILESDISLIHKPYFPDELAQKVREVLGAPGPADGASGIGGG